MHFFYENNPLLKIWDYLLSCDYHYLPSRFQSYVCNSTTELSKDNLYYVEKKLELNETSGSEREVLKETEQSSRQEN